MYFSFNGSLDPFWILCIIWGIQVKEKKIKIDISCENKYFIDIRLKNKHESILIYLITEYWIELDKLLSKENVIVKKKIVVSRLPYKE